MIFPLNNPNSFDPKQENKIGNLILPLLLRVCLLMINQFERLKFFIVNKMGKRVVIHLSWL